jgi:hypothetical protein
MRCTAGHSDRSTDMLDVIYVIGGCAFFAVAILYTYACDRL